MFIFKWRSFKENLCQAIFPFKTKNSREEGNSQSTFRFNEIFSQIKN